MPLLAAKSSPLMRAQTIKFNDPSAIYAMRSCVPPSLSERVVETIAYGVLSIKKRAPQAPLPRCFDHAVFGKLSAHARCANIDADS
jgi:hypothetical protein